MRTISLGSSLLNTDISTKYGVVPPVACYGVPRKAIWEQRRPPLVNDHTWHVPVERIILCWHEPLSSQDSAGPAGRIDKRRTSMGHLLIAN